MKTIFRFENGTSQLILIPETAREKQYISLFREGDMAVRLSTEKSNPESLMFENHLTKKEPNEKIASFDPGSINRPNTNF